MERTKKFICISATKHYKIECTIDPVDKSKYGITNAKSSLVYWLPKSVCKINPSSGCWYAKQALHTRPSNLNKTYKTWYDSSYSTNLNLDVYDVHHIRPLAYGGDNTMGNLLHLPKQFDKGVTAWWAGY